MHICGHVAVRCGPQAYVDSILICSNILQTFCSDHKVFQRFSFPFVAMGKWLWVHEDDDDPDSWRGYWAEMKFRNLDFVEPYMKKYRPDGYIRFKGQHYQSSMWEHFDVRRPGKGEFRYTGEHFRHDNRHGPELRMPKYVPKKGWNGRSAEKGIRKGSGKYPGLAATSPAPAPAPALPAFPPPPPKILRLGPLGQKGALGQAPPQAPALGQTPQEGQALAGQDFVLPNTTSAASAASEKPTLVLPNITSAASAASEKPKLVLPKRMLAGVKRKHTEVHVID